MARKRGFSRGTRKSGKKNQLWSIAVQDEVTIAAGALLNTSIVVPGDWARDPGGALEHATVLTVVGWFSMSNKIIGTTVGSLGGFHCAIIASHEDVGFALQNPSTAATYASNRIMWTGGSTIPATPAEGNHHERWEINLKTGRRITSGDDIRFLANNGSGGNVQVSGVFRALLQLGGN